VRLTAPGGILLAGALVLTSAACSDAPVDPAPTARDLARGVSTGHVARVPWTGATRAVVRRDLAHATDGLGGLRPAVRLVRLRGTDDRRTATLVVRWDVDRTNADWTYRTRARLVLRDGRWRVRWSPALLYPRLTPGDRLVLQHTSPPRAEVTGAGGTALVTDRPVRRIGIDRTKVVAASAEASARRLADVVGVDPGSLAKRVAAAGPRAFVLAVTLRSRDAEPLLARVADVPGAIALETAQPLAPTREFARPILGSVGDATAEIVAQSHGAVVPGDIVGLSGLQQRYDAQLRGTPGVDVALVPAGNGVTRKVFHKDPQPGTSLATTLDEAAQRLAERILAGVGPASALVAVRPSTGAVLAAASGPGGNGLSTATTGRYAPGSTFKVVSSLALLRAGLTPTTSMRCPSTLVVDGKRFKNYSDYPSSGLGPITLATAVANSCNTAFIGQRGAVDQAALARAAASLGLGVDHDLGAPAFLGSVPDTAASQTEHAASLIGQGRVLASPLAMAGVAASVAAGRTVVPHLLDATVPTDVASSLTAAEAATLRDLMYGVVARGSGRFLQPLESSGPRIGAKTGTAEYGDAQPLRTHGWMIAVRGDLAVAVFVQDAQSGSGTAGPLLARFLQGVR
jgi:cell division protein FtsI/penicillin-binding protein 2